MSAEHAEPDFPVVRRGYDIDEVDRFVGNLDNIWEAKLNEAVARIARLELELTEAKRREEAVHLTLVTATKTKEELIEAAQRDLADATGNAREQAEQVLTEAKFEAFRLVTEANKDAGQVIEQARAEADELGNRAAAAADATAEADQILGDATAEAERVVAAAQSEALQMLTEIKDESERMVAEREGELDRMRAQFETDHAEAISRVRNLQALAADLEHRLQTVAAGAAGELQTITSELAASDIESPQATTPTPQDTASSEVPPLDSIPEEARPAESTPEPEETDKRPAPQLQEPDDQTESNRGSFYSRRSARLPRIGPEAASMALAAVSAMRAAQSRDDNDIEIVVTEGDPDRDVAMQTA